MFCVVRACLISNKAVKSCLNIHEILQLRRWSLKGSLSEVFKLLSNSLITYRVYFLHYTWWVACTLYLIAHAFLFKVILEIWMKNIDQLAVIFFCFKYLLTGLSAKTVELIVSQIRNENCNWHKISFRNSARYIKRYYRNVLYMKTNQNSVIVISVIYQWNHVVFSCLY